MKRKENANADFREMTMQSWTFARMTTEEQKRCVDALKFAKVSGTYDMRWEALQSVYRAFLLGIGYTDSGWRRNEDEPLF